MKKIIYCILFLLLDIFLYSCSNDDEAIKTDEDYLVEYLDKHRCFKYDIVQIHVFENLPCPWNIMIGWSLSGISPEPEKTRCRNYIYSENLENWDNTDNWDTYRAIKATIVYKDGTNYTEREYFFFNRDNTMINNTLDNLKATYLNNVN